MRRALRVLVVALALLALSADDAYAWRRRRGVRSSRPLTAGEACCLLPVVGVLVIFSAVSKAQRRAQGFTSMGRHRRRW